MDAGHVQAQRRELGGLIVHEGDEGRNDQRRAPQSDGRKLITKRLAGTGGHDQQQVLASESGAADRFLIGAEAGKAEDRAQQAA